MTSSASGATTYTSSYAYAPHGAVSAVTLGNGLAATEQFNNRLQPTQIQAGALLTLNFSFNAGNNNGNMQSQTITAPKDAGGSLILTQNYAYDGVNRLLSVSEGAWSRAYSYDAFGNRALDDPQTTPALAPRCAAENIPLGCSSANGAVIDKPAYEPLTNRLNSDWADYDDAGNVLAFKDPIGSLTSRRWAAFYDGENKQRFYCAGTTAACDSQNATAEYRYDGGGRRVEKLTATETITYVYDAFGQLAAEYSSQGPSAAGGTFYRTTDHLGSTRLVTDSSANVISRRDFFPFGEEIPANTTFGNRNSIAAYNTADGIAQRFTAKERDTESGLDYFLARYYSGALGRFTSVDPGNAGALAEAPQSWNGYSYVENRPTFMVDPDGRFGNVAVGALIGGGIGLVVGLVQEVSAKGITGLDAASAQNIGATTLGGAVSGGIAGATFGASLALAGAGEAGLAVAVSVGGGAGGNVLGGAITRGADADANSQALDPGKVAVDAALGGAGGALGAVASGVTRSARGLETTKKIVETSARRARLGGRGASAAGRSAQGNANRIQRIEESARTAEFTVGTATPPTVQKVIKAITEEEEDKR